MISQLREKCASSILIDTHLNWKSVHQCNTRLAKKKSFYLPKIRTNYGKFNIRFHGVKVWNSIPDKLKDKPSTFKRHLTESLLNNYSTQK